MTCQILSGWGVPPMRSTRRTEKILFVHHCIHVLYLCSGRPVMCYLRISSSVVAAVRVDLPILRHALEPINVPMPLLTQTKSGWSRPRDVQTCTLLFFFGALSSLHN